MITSYWIERTFKIKYDEFQGTAFAYDVAHGHFLISSKMNFPGCKHKEKVEFFVYVKQEWTKINAVFLCHNNPLVDVVLLKMSKNLFGVSLSTVEAFTQAGPGVSVAIMGFPLGSYPTDVKSSVGYPVPFVKKLSICGWTPKSSPVKTYYLDGVNHPGFAGGPCMGIIKDVVSQYYPDKVGMLGVIAGYEPLTEVIKHPAGSYEYTLNATIIEVQSIKYALEIPLT